jgi:hypothetical protein
MQDYTTRAQRMKRLPPVTLKDYAMPMVYAVVFVPLLYVAALAWFVISPVILGIV